MQVGDFVRLRGRSRHGINRLNEHGNHWRVASVTKTRVLLKTFWDESDLRWVDLYGDDEHFQIMESWTPATHMRKSLEHADRVAIADAAMGDAEAEGHKDDAGPWTVESGDDVN